MYLEQVCFAINRAGCSVTKIYSHFTFEQECFKKEFILMNQRFKKNAKKSIEKDFYKLMNNSNFGCDCCNNLDNCQNELVLNTLVEFIYLVIF